MKIFLSFLQGRPGHPISAYGFWEYYIKNGIKEAGFEVDECTDVDWVVALVPQSAASLAAWKADAWGKTVWHIKNRRPDIFLSYFYPHHIDEAAIREIQKLGIPCVNFFCDNVRNYTKAPAEYGVFDLNWVPEYKALGMYRRAGFPAVHRPMPMWVAPEHRILAEETLRQITFIGSCDKQRLSLFESVAADAGDLPLAIYGAGWSEGTGVAAANPVDVTYGLRQKLAYQTAFIRKEGIKAYGRKLQQRGLDLRPSATIKKYLYGKPDFQEYVRLSQESMVTVGINRYESYRFPLHKPDSYSRLRDIEAPMLGACYMTEWTEGLDELYDLDNEILAYGDALDFREKADKLLADAGFRRRLRINGQKRALNEHSIPVTLQKIKEHFKLR